MGRGSRLAKGVLEIRFLSPVHSRMIGDREEQASLCKLIVDKPLIKRSSTERFVSTSVYIECCLVVLLKRRCRKVCTMRLIGGGGRVSSDQTDRSRSACIYL